MITPNITSFRGRGDKIYFSILDCDTIIETKKITSGLKKEKYKVLYKHLKEKRDGKVGYRLYVLKEIILDEDEIEFLRESNRIEDEYSISALRDAMYAYQYAKEMIIEKKQTLTIEHILTIYNLLMRRLNKSIVGKWRNVAVTVGGEYKPKERKYILRKKIQGWIDNCIVTKLGVEEDIRRWHILFEKIHPFTDGNGRLGRILINIQRLNHQLPIMIIHVGDEQKKYYKWFKEMFEIFTCKRCGELTKHEYCDTCYNSTCVCGRKSYGKQYCLYCFQRGNKKR